jgi:hypothetical protein
MRNNLFWRKQMYDSGADSGGGNSRRYWRDGKLYSTYSDPEHGHLMRDSFGNWIPDTRWQTLPTRALDNVGNFLGDAMVGGLKGVQATEGWLDDRYEDVVDFFDRDRYASSGPLARHGYRHHPGGYDIPANAVLTPEAQAFRDRPALGSPHTQVTLDNTPSHLIPGYNRMVNEGYDSWSPSDGHSRIEKVSPYDNGNDLSFGNAFRTMFEGGTEVVQQDTRSEWQKWKDSVNSGRR